MEDTHEPEKPADQVITPASRKRKVDQVADSEDEDSDDEYQWMDEALA